MNENEQKQNPNLLTPITMNESSIASRERLPVYDTLVTAALRMRSRSYAPYSHYHVGAALMATDGTIFTGCNVENASYPVGICAERTAFSKAVSEGYQEFTALVIAGAASASAGSDFCAPCGMCRQFIREFCNADFPIILVKAAEHGIVKEYQIHTLEALLPHSFGPEHLHAKSLSDI